MDTDQTNPAKLVWPQDTVGMTSQLRREGCRAIGRMSGDGNNLELVIGVLRVLAFHAKAKFLEQEISRDLTLLKLANKRLDQGKENDRVADAMRTSLVNQRDAISNRLEALAQRKATAKANWEEVKRRREAGEEQDLDLDHRAMHGIGSAKSG